jgi:hypothetical protein
MLPTVRLPDTFAKLAGLSTRVCQTLYNGALAFLVVIARTDETPENVTRSQNRPPSQNDSVFESNFGIFIL